MRTLLRVFLIVVVMLLAKPAWAQREGTPYQVIGDKPVNARACPRLNCAVVQTIQPGETVTVLDTVTGDVALGSDQWHKVEVNGAEMYIHSALVIEATDSGTTDEAAPEPVEVDTSDWVRYEGKGYSFLHPGGLLSLEDILADPDIMDGLAEESGFDPEDLVKNLRSYLNQYEAVLWDMSGSGIELRIDIYNPDSRSPRLLRAVWSALYKSAGDEILSAEIIDLPAGKTIVIHRKAKTRSSVTKGTEWMDYEILTDTAIFEVQFVCEHSFPDDARPYFDAIVRSVRRGGTSGKPT